MINLHINGIYKHFKGGLYKVIHEAKDCDTLEELVVYENVNSHEVWVRKKSEFLSLVDKEKYPNVEQTYRLELVCNEEASNNDNKFDSFIESRFNRRG